MKFKIGAYLMILAGVMMLLSACEGGNDATVPIALTRANNPVLVNYSTVVAANFSNYTSLIKFGSPVTFTVAPDPGSFLHVSPGTASFSQFSTVTARVVNTNVAGMAWVTVRSPLPGRFIVTATSETVHGTTNFGGSTTVSFIDQPATVQVRLGLRKPLTNVGLLDFDLVSSQPAPVFVNFSGIQSPFIWNEDTAPILPPGGVPEDGATNLIIGSLQGINIGALKPLFRYDFVPIPPSVPTFVLANIVSHAADNNATPLTPSLFIMSTKYFDAAGNELFY
ncbi:MAG TPA: hypothetical protein VI298_08165 [Geobacteraceae bacterium]